MHLDACVFAAADVCNSHSFNVDAGPALELHPVLVNLVFRICQLYTFCSIGWTVLIVGCCV